MNEIGRIEQPLPSGNARMGWASDVAAEMLRRLKLKYVAHNPGSSFAGLHDSIVNYLGNDDPTMLLCLNEGAAVAIAHGYAKTAEHPMGVILHSNVGFMNGIMAIYNAWVDRVPVYIVGASGPHDAAQRTPWIHWIHTFKDQAAMVRHFIKWDDTPGSAEAVIESMLRANILGRTAPMGPTYVNLDVALQQRALDREVRLPEVERFAVPALPEPARADIERAADLLLVAKSPVILMGRVSRDQGDWDRRVRLAELLGAAVCTDHKVGAQFPTDHKLHVGLPGVHFRAEGHPFVANSDVLLALDWIDLAGHLKQVYKGGPARTRIIQCQVDSYVHNGFSMDHFGLAPADVPILADPDLCVRRILEIVEQRLSGKPRWDGKAKGPGYPKFGRLSDRDAKGPVDLATLGLAVAEARTRHDICLGRTSLGWIGETNHYRGPMDYLGSDGGGGVGAGPGNAVGMALGLMGTGKIALSVIGDGDFIQGVQALWTAAHYRIPALIVVVDNRSHLNDELIGERIAKARGRAPENVWIGQRFTDPPLDICGLAKAQGVEAIGVTKAGELEGALERAIEVVKGGAPCLVDVLAEERVSSTSFATEGVESAGRR
jgi:thiamine pyrophosphate-dependent acetolactate synthase large subunit-like protein